MTKRRGLADLWVKGKTLTFDDGDGPIEVWLQKPNSNETEQARRRADAARARVLVLRAKPESDEYLSAVGNAFDSADVDQLVNVLLQPEEARLHQLHDAELAAEEEWTEDAYLQGLRDLWIGELADAYAKDEADPEAVRVFAELKRFEAEVQKRVDEDLADRRAGMLLSSVEDLQTKVAEMMLKNSADMAWLIEFRKSQVWLACRDATDHQKREFKERHELDPMQDETFTRLRDALESLLVEPLEGKDLEETPSSSISSAPPAAEETEESSGLVAVGQ